MIIGVKTLFYSNSKFFSRYDLNISYMNVFRRILLERMLPALIIAGIVIICGTVGSSTLAQPIGTWKSYTSQSTVFELVQDSAGRLWAVTEGGIFTVEDNEIALSLTPTEGMYRINPQKMEYDAQRDQIWLGYSDGMFEAYDPATKLFRPFNDIARATRFSPRGINSFVLMDGNLLIATDFGLVLFDPDREVTIDTYSNLGAFPSGARVNSVMVHDGQIFAGTSDGVAVSTATGGDLVVPDSWTAYGQAEGLGGNISAVVFFQDTPHALMGNTILRFTGTEWQNSDIFSGKVIDDLATSKNGEYLVAWNSTEIMLWPEPPAGGNLSIAEGLPINGAWVDDANGVNNADDRLFIGATNQGIYVINLRTGEQERQFLPSGPYMNTFSGLSIRDGILASGSNNLWGRRGVGTSQSGYYLFRNNEWENYNNRTHPVLQQKNFNSTYTSTSTSDYFFFGSWGRGVAQHHIATNEVTVWDKSNSVLDGIRPGSEFIVVSGLASDRQDHLWVISKLNPISPLYRFIPETGEWTAFPRLQGVTPADLYELVTVDSHDQLWIPIQNDRNEGRGIVVKRIDGNEIRNGVILRDEAGRGNLPHPRVNAVVQDRRGEIWIGTQRGLARFAFPQRVIDGGTADRQASLLINADETADSPFLLRTSNVTSIAVNSANQKWIGTDGEGVWLIEEDGGRHRAIRNFTAENSPLISNTILSVAYDDVTGQVFMATDLGLVSYTDVVRGSVAEMDELFIYPNPFSYRNEVSERVVIDGLSSQTIIRILTVDGRLVRRLDTRGGRVEWDVRDFKGDRVATGVYVVVAADSQNDQRGVGKLVVIR